jgi:hypothetical protein
MSSDPIIHKRKAKAQGKRKRSEEDAQEATTLENATDIQELSDDALKDIEGGAARSPLAARDAARGSPS